MCLSGCLAACVCGPAQMIKWAGPSKVTFFVTQLQSVPLSEAVNLCFHQPGSLYPCLCKAHHQGNVIKHLLKVSHSPVEPPLTCRQKRRSCSTVRFYPQILANDADVSVCIKLCVYVPDSDQGGICLLAAASPGGWDVDPRTRAAALWVGPATGNKPAAFR